MAERVRIRADGHPMARLLESIGVDLADVPPAADGWHSHDSLLTATVNGLLAAEARRLAAAPSMSPQQAYDSDRITAKSFASWEQRYNADPTGIGRVLASLMPYPGVNDGDPGRVAVSAGHRSPSARPRLSRLEELEERLYGPSSERREQAEAEQAERELAEIEAAETEQVTASGLTDDEYRSLFPAASGE